VFHVKHEGWGLEAFPAQVRDRLQHYAALLEVHAIPAGLIAKGDTSTLMTRHVMDSLRGMTLIPSDVRDVVDLGSGAGLPGIPLALVLPRQMRFTLVDSRRSRISFLELAVDDLGLSNVRVLSSRVEEVSDEFDVSLARGFAPPTDSWNAASRVLRPRGRLLYWAGATFHPTSAPQGARGESVGPPGLESGGPIVIMTRQ